MTSATVQGKFSLHWSNILLFFVAHISCLNYFQTSHRPLRRVLAQDILNPLSRLLLEGGVVDGDVVQVRTLGECEKLRREKLDLTWVSSNEESDDKNSVVIIRNHETKLDDGSAESWEDDEFLMEDGIHEHR